MAYEPLPEPPALPEPSAPAEPPPLPVPALPPVPPLECMALLPDIDRLLPDDMLLACMPPPLFWLM